MSLQQIIDTAVNVEVNRSKLVAQNVSRSGRISTNSRNWANPYRFVVTPKPIWTASEYRSIFEPIFNADRYAAQPMYLNNVNISTGLPTLNNSWMTAYQGGCDTTANNNNLDTFAATSACSGTTFVLRFNGTATAAGLYIVKKGDWLRPSGHNYPYQATEDVIVPTVATGITGTITAAGTAVVYAGNIRFTTTTTRTTITGITSTTGLSVGQVITESGTNTGSFGGLTYIASIDSATQITIQSTTANTAGAITFNGAGAVSAGDLVVVPIHRGFIGALSTNTNVRVGSFAALFNVIVTKLPQIRYLPGKFVEFTGDFELIEEIL